LYRHESENLPSPFFAKEGRFTSLGYLFPAESRQREVRRDFIKQCRYYYETVNKWILATGFKDFKNG
jgi:hypothetical protein